MDRSSSSMESHSQIENDAAAWLAERDSGRWDEGQEGRFQQWLGASTARRVAYLRLKSTWDAAARLRVLRAGVTSASLSGEIPPPGAWRRSPFFDPAAPQVLSTSARAHGSPAAESAVTLHSRRWHLAAAAAVVLFAFAAAFVG